MKSQLSYTHGWMGGHFSLGGQQYSFSKKPSGTLYLKGKTFPIVYEVENGEDDDHGHVYRWSLTHPGIIDGKLKPRFLSAVSLLEDGPVYIKLND